MALYERLFPRLRPRRELRPGRGDAALRPTWLGTAGFVIEASATTLLVDPFLSRPSIPRLARRLVTDDLHEEPICAPAKDARGAVLTAS